jgi:ATP-binding cassette, subfamily B, multidrug efflux pump
MFSVLLKLGWFFKQHWRRYACAILLLIVASVLEIIPPRLIGIAIDDMYQGNMTSERLMQLIAFFIALIVVTYFITYVWMYQLFGGAFLVERTMRSRFMRHLLKMKPAFFERNKTGDLMARATNDLKAISTTAGFGILTLLDSSIWLMAILLTMGFVISWKLTFAALLPLPIMAVAISIYGKKINERFATAQQSFGDMNDRVLENVSGVRVIRAYVREEASRQQFQQLTDEVYRKNMSVARIHSLFEPTIKVLVGISYLIGLGYGAYLVFQNEITLGELVSFNVYLGMLIWPMFAIGELVNIMQRGNASLDRVNKTLSAKPDVLPPTTTERIETPGAIAFQHVTFRYPSSAVANLLNINIRLEKGHTLGVVGRTGSGKSTLLKQLLREFPLEKGRITFDDIPLERIDPDTLTSWIGYVPQEQILFSKTVQENIRYGRPEADEERLEHVLASSALQKDIALLPDGLQTLVGEKGVALSGGQKQRVSIARALFIEPEILILDDALSAVDGKTEANIIANIRRERAGKTTIISTHRLSTVQHADFIVVMDDGRIVEEGTHDQLIRHGGWYKEQYERQQLETGLTKS